MAYAFPAANVVIGDVQNMVGEVAAAQVEIFTEPMLYSHLNKTFNLLFTKYTWEHYRRWSQLTLSGVDGKATTGPFADLRDFTDIKRVFKSGTSNPMPMLNGWDNPYLLTGTRAIAFTGLPHTDTDFQTHRLQFWPLDAVEDIVVGWRLHPGEIVAATKLYIDRDLLAYGTAWNALDDEGTNQAGAGRYQQLYDLRWRDLMAQYADHPTQFDTRGPIPTSWREAP